MKEKAKELQREYMRKYREQNRKRINILHKKWRDAHKERIKQYIKNYWNKKAMELQTEKEKEGEIKP